MSNDASARASDEEVNVLNESAFEKANFREIYIILKEEAVRVRKEREAFESVTKKLKDVHLNTTFKLNVGGHYFTTSLQTLNKDPGSMLHAMFSGRFDTKPSDDGSYFIDRDGTHFRYILNYLRTGQLLLPDDKLIKKEVLAEAQFYQIQEIVEKLESKPFLGSKILIEKAQRETVAAWLPEDKQLNIDEMKLLYRATIDGWTSRNFHSCCDNKGATVVVVKSGEYIFGGFTECPWNSGSGYTECKQAFVFSLKNTSGIGSVKLPLRPGQEGDAIYCKYSFGPTFGAGHDLYIVSNPNTNNCSTMLNLTY